MTQTIPVDTTILQEILKRLDELSRDVEEIKETVSSENLPMVDEETNRQIGLSLKDLAKGRYTVLKTKKDIKDFVDKL